MAKKRFWKLEYSVTLFVILGVLLLLTPVSIESTRQAGFITRWKENYSRMEYVLKVIETHISDDMIKNFSMAKSSDEKEQLFLLILKPYLRLTPARLPSNYRISYMNKSRVNKNDINYFKEYYYSDNGVLIGIKDMNHKKDNEPYFTMMFDVNGMLPPNTWGNDVFGLTIYNGRIEPFGYGVDSNKLQSDCSSVGLGLTCSYYYLIGGEFVE